MVPEIRSAEPPSRGDKDRANGARPRKERRPPHPFLSGPEVGGLIAPAARRAKRDTPGNPLPVFPCRTDSAVAGLISVSYTHLGVTVLNITEKYSFGESMANSFGSGLGFFLAMVLFAGIRARTENCEAPESFKGLPITLTAAAILAASFSGFAGVVETLFGA